MRMMIIASALTLDAGAFILENSDVSPGPIKQTGRTLGHVTNNSDFRGVFFARPSSHPK